MIDERRETINPWEVAFCRTYILVNAMAGETKVSPAMRETCGLIAESMTKYMPGEGGTMLEIPSLEALEEYLAWDHGNGRTINGKFVEEVDMFLRTIVGKATRDTVGLSGPDFIKAAYDLIAAREEGWKRAGYVVQPTAPGERKILDSSGKVLVSLSHNCGRWIAAFGPGPPWHVWKESGSLVEVLDHVDGKLGLSK